ncbi:MAG: hypothetical protein U0R49_01695 [Fimbriimonadales bacterium]
MKFCEHCFSQIEPADEFCKECGAPVAVGPAADTSDSVIYPELARANLFRLRGNFAEAEKVLLAVLKRYPGNTTSQVLMGDLNAEKGDSRQALQWYSMAGDIAKDIPGLQPKIDRVRAAIESEEAHAATSELEVKTGGFPFMFISFIAGIILVVSAGAFWIAGARSKQKERDSLDKISLPISINQPAGPVAKGNPQTGTKTTESPSPVPSSGAGMTSAEKEMLASVTSSLGQIGVSLQSLTVDPRTHSAVITGTSPDAEGSLVLIARVGHAVITGNSSLGRATVRLIDPTSGQLACIGTVEASALGSATAEVGSADWATALVSEFWKP